MSTSQIAGLPEGVEVVRYGLAADDEFIFDRLIYGPASENRQFSGLVVRPAEGYDFVYDIGRDCHVATKSFAKSKTFRATFRVGNSRDEEVIRGMMKHTPGFQKLEEA